MHSTTMKTINILMLGETGVGKSTFINGFVNYLTYKTLEDAENGPDVSKIPTYFTIPPGKNNKEIVVETGVTDENEFHGAGASSTQLPMTHSFQIDQDRINIIDTPGVGDSRGLELDRQHFLTIIQHICNKYTYVNAICILLPPNHSKLSTTFQFCIEELLAHLHRNACHNIVFCFTSTRGSNFGPGDTYFALKELLNKSNVDGIELNDQTMYCFDNESIRFLAAIRQGVVFDPRTKEENARSWSASEEEMCRLLEHIVSLKPHVVRDTQALNKAKRTINILMGPMVDMENEILKQHASLKKKKEEIQECLAKGKKYNGDLAVSFVHINYKYLKHAKTVCASQKCLEIVKIDAKGTTQTIYPQTCHEPCSFWFQTVEPEKYPCEALKGCRAFREDNNYYLLPTYKENCTKCECKWDQHMHVKTEIEKESVDEKDENVEKLLAENKSEQEVLEAHVRTLTHAITQLEEASRTISQISHKFEHFLSRNAIAPLSDAREGYIQYRIRNATNAVARGANETELRALERMLEEYRREKKEFEKVVATSPKEESIKLLNPDEISQLENELYRVPHYGKTFLKLKEDDDGIANKANRRCSVVKYDPPAVAAQSTSGEGASKLWSFTKGILKKRN